MLQVKDRAIIWYSSSGRSNIKLAAGKYISIFSRDHYHIQYHLHESDSAINRNASILQVIEKIRINSPVKRFIKLIRQRLRN